MAMPMRYFLNSIFLCFIVFVFISCGEKNKESTSVETIKVEAKPNTTTMYYSGFIKPLESMDVTNTKADGVITEIGFDYGERVKKDQLLFVMISKQFVKDYQTGLAELIKAKQNLANVQYQMTGTEELKKLKIVSEQEYLNVKSQMFNAELETAQAERRFNELLQVAGITKEKLSKLDINDPKSIIHALSEAPSSIKIVAPISGTALFSSTSKEGTLPHVGAEVKLGQVLVSIVNETGVLVVIKVTELDVNKIQEKQQANISGDAFPGITLKGVVQHVDRAASTEGSGGVPTFLVEVVYPHLNPEQDEIIRVGMRAEVAIPFTTLPIIKIPLTAVYTKGNQSFVKKRNKKTGKLEEVAVETRGTDVNAIEITGGLSSGDEVVINAPSH